MFRTIYNYFSGSEQDHINYFEELKEIKWDELKIYKELCKTMELAPRKYNLNHLYRLVEKEKTLVNDFMDIKKSKNENYLDDIIYLTNLNSYSVFLKETLNSEYNKIIDWIVIKDNAKYLNNNRRIKFKSKNNSKFYLLKKN